MHCFDISSHAAHLHTGELVAVKVQRPGMTVSLTLDALLFDMIGGQLKRFAKARKDLLGAVNEMVRFLLCIDVLISLDCLIFCLFLISLFSIIYVNLSVFCKKKV